MKQLFHLTVVLIILSAVLTGSVIAYARANNEGSPLHAIRFDMCGEAMRQPCFAGITPNTSWETVDSILAAQKLDTSYESDGLIFVRVHDTTVAISANMPRTRVIELNTHFQPFNQSPTRPEFRLGNFIAQYGSPCLVKRHNNFVVLNYPQFTILAKLVEERISPEADTLHMYIADNGFCEASADAVRWSGFISAAHYEPTNPNTIP